MLHSMVQVKLKPSFKKKAEVLLKTEELNMTHQQIADKLGTARKVVSHLLKQLERDEKISLGRNKIKNLAGM